MANDSINRDAVRTRIAALLDTAMVSGTPQIVKAVYAYKVDFRNQQPVIVVLSAGVHREQRGLDKEKWITDVRVAVIVFVADVDAASGWDGQAIENRLDLIEKGIADVVKNNRQATEWKHLSYDSGFTQPERVTIGGKSYHMETITLIAHAWDA